VRLAVAGVLLASFVHAAFGQDLAKPVELTIGSETFRIIESDSGEKRLLHGTRVLIADSTVDEGLAASFGAVHARVFTVSPGGGDCDGWPAVVTVASDGKVDIDLTMKGLCGLYAATRDDEGFTFVDRPLPGYDGAVWRFTPEQGLRRLGVLAFRPQPGTTWQDISRYTSHPLRFFYVAPFDAEVRRLTGANYREFVTRLHVGSDVKQDGGFVSVTGCKAHNCPSDRAFVGIDIKAGAAFLAMLKDRRITTWPALSRWPKPLREAYGEWSGDRR
jgi:hypothetical protein